MYRCADGREVQRLSNIFLAFHMPMQESGAVRTELRQKYQKRVNVNGDVLHQTVEIDDERDDSL